jgi:hypothetical protein
MSEQNLTKRQKIMLYLINKLNEIEGRKKLMKLMFLVEHYNVELKKLTKKSSTDNGFIIYHYGVFSFKVFDDYLDLHKKDLIEESPIRTKIQDIELEPELQKQVDSIIELFGDKTGAHLETETLKMLGHTIESKREVSGVEVNTLIKD